MQGDGPEEYADYQAELEAEAQAQGEAEQAEYDVKRMEEESKTEIDYKQIIADQQTAISSLGSDIESIKKELAYHRDRLTDLEGRR